MKTFEITVKRTYTTTIQFDTNSNMEDFLIVSLRKENGMEFKDNDLAETIIDIACEKELEQMDTDGLEIVSVNDVTNKKT